MDGIRRRLVALLLLACGAGAQGPDTPAAARTLVATPAPPGVTAELSQTLQRARERFEARDLAGVLAAVSEQYRSGGMTKAAVREQLLAMFALYQELRAHASIDRVELVSGGTRVYTSGEITGRLPLMGWVTVLTWQGEPEVVRREAAGWRLFGFQD